MKKHSMLHPQISCFHFFGVKNCRVLALVWWFSMVYEFLHIEIPLPQVDTQFQQTSQNLLTCPWNLTDNVMQYLVGLTYDNLLQKTHSMVVWSHALLVFLMLRSSMEKKNLPKKPNKAFVPWTHNLWNEVAIHPYLVWIVVKKKRKRIKIWEEREAWNAKHLVTMIELSHLSLEMPPFSLLPIWQGPPCAWASLCHYVATNARIVGHYHTHKD